jgi:hypothetical protein
LVSWKLQEANQAIQDLVEAGELRSGFQFENQSGEWAVLSSLVQSAWA